MLFGVNSNSDIEVSSTTTFRALVCGDDGSSRTTDGEREPRSKNTCWGGQVVPEVLGLRSELGIDAGGGSTCCCSKRVPTGLKAGAQLVCRCDADPAAETPSRGNALVILVADDTATVLVSHANRMDRVAEEV